MTLESHDVLRRVAVLDHSSRPPHVAWNVTFVVLDSIERVALVRAISDLSEE